MLERLTIWSCTPWRTDAAEQLRAIGPIGCLGRRIDASQFGYAAGSVLVRKSRLSATEATYGHFVDTCPNQLFTGQYDYSDLVDLAAKFWDRGIVESSGPPCDLFGPYEAGEISTDDVTDCWRKMLSVVRYSLIADLPGTVIQWASAMDRQGSDGWAHSIRGRNVRFVCRGGPPFLDIVQRDADTTRIRFEAEGEGMLLGRLAPFFDGDFSFCRHAGLVVGDMASYAGDQELRRVLELMWYHDGYPAGLDLLSPGQRSLVTVTPGEEVRQQIDAAFRTSYGLPLDKRTNQLLKKARATLVDDSQCRRNEHA